MEEFFPDRLLARHATPTVPVKVAGLTTSIMEPETP
jgi:hypothetical protein